MTLDASRTERRSVGFTGPSEHVAAGSTIFREGDPGDVMYGVRAGEVSIRLRGIEVETAGPGDFFGELAMIDHGPRSADASAKTDCELVRIDERPFQFMVQQTPYFALEVMRAIAVRLRSMNAKL
jgi:CRP/FNR family cyclic AMP-dependent transcriptional regulator